MLKKYFLPLFLVFTILLPNFSSALDFTDVPPDSSYSLPINFLRSIGVVVGYPDNTYHPQDYLVRSVAAKIVLSAYAQDSAFLLDIPELDPASTYPDMTPTSWFAKYLVKAELMSIWGPDADGYYGPERAVSRAELMKLVLVPAGIDLNNFQDAKMFGDVPASAWFTKYMNFAGKYGIITPDKDGNLYPSQLLTRGEATEIGYKLFLILKKENSALLIGRLQDHVRKAIYFLSISKPLLSKANTSFAVGLGEALYNSDPSNAFFVANAKLAKAANYTINYKITGKIVGAEQSSLSWLTLAQTKLQEGLDLDASITEIADLLKASWEI